jgi:hypothetical protein
MRQTPMFLSRLKATGEPRIEQKVPSQPTLERKRPEFGRALDVSATLAVTLRGF